MLQEGETVKEGTFLYGGEITCDIRIVKSHIRWGSGDLDDPPELQNDIEGEYYYVWYGSTTERKVFNASGGCFSSLEEAVESIAKTPGIGSTVRWVS